jgi:hypothetical protein
MVQKIFANEVQPVARRGAALTREKIDDAKFNAGLLGCQKPRKEKRLPVSTEGVTEEQFTQLSTERTETAPVSDSDSQMVSLSQLL